MFNAHKLLMGLIGGSATGGSFGGGTMGESLIGGAAGKLLTGKRGRRNRKKLVKYGALAAVGALAFTAYKKYQDSASGGASAATGSSGGNFSGGNSPANMTGQPAVSSSDSSFSLGSSSGSDGSSAAGVPLANAGPAEPEVQLPVAFMPTGEAEQADLSMTLVRAMIAAASCDGYFDDTEKAKVLSRVQETDLSAEDQAALEGEIQRPLTIDALAQAASTPQIATEIYVASRLAIEVDSETERRYLHKLADKLSLEPKLVKEIEKQLASG